MDKLKFIQISIFLTFFAFGYVVVNYLVLKFFGVNSILFSIILSTLFFLSFIFEQRRHSLVFQLIYIFSMAWLGFVLFLLWGVLIISIIGFFVPVPFIFHEIILVLGVSVASYATINGMRINVKKLELRIKGLDKDLSFIQLSDLHLGSMRNREFIKRLKNKIEYLNPDAILITGDLADGDYPMGEFLKIFDDLKVPIFFVSGNHDAYMGLENLFDSLEAAGIVIVDQRVVKFMGVQIIGVGYMYSNMLEMILERLDFDPDKPSILLHHLPINWEIARSYGIDLQLSGHTHGGQFYPFNIIVGLIFPHIAGLYENSGSYLYVSEGTGTWGPPMRLGSCNEIVLFKLKP